METHMSLYVVGIGPGRLEGMTLEAKAVIEACEVIVGYTVYTELIQKYFPEKLYYTTPMKQELERCKWALSQAYEGKEVAVVCSGDAGVYGMAGLIWQLHGSMTSAAVKASQKPEIIVIPGVTAALSGGALLGAPLTHDFAVISLSDLLTPIDTIWNRVRCAAMSDMVICLYNPSSQKRGDYLQKACDIVLAYQKEDTVCGYVKNIGREGETVRILSLGELRRESVDMFTTVYIGNSTTAVICDKMVTPRGYRNV